MEQLRWAGAGRAAGAGAAGGGARPRPAAAAAAAAGRARGSTPRTPARTPRTAPPPPPPAAAAAPRLSPATRKITSLRLRRGIGTSTWDNSQVNKYRNCQ